MICEIVLGFFIFFVVSVLIVIMFRKKLQAFIMKKVMEKAIKNITGEIFK